jgi:hypothetical protein
MSLHILSPSQKKQNEAGPNADWIVRAGNYGINTLKDGAHESKRERIGGGAHGALIVQRKNRRLNIMSFVEKEREMKMSTQDKVKAERLNARDRYVDGYIAQYQ